MNGQNRLERLYLAIIAAGEDDFALAAKRAIRADAAFTVALYDTEIADDVCAIVPNADPNLRVYHVEPPEPLPAPEERTAAWVERSLEYTQSVIAELRSLGDPDKARALTTPLIAWRPAGECVTAIGATIDVPGWAYAYDPVGNRLLGDDSSFDLCDPDSRPYLGAWLRREAGLLKLKAELRAEASA